MDVSGYSKAMLSLLRGQVVQLVMADTGCSLGAAAKALYEEEQAQGLTGRPVTSNWTTTLAMQVAVRVASPDFDPNEDPFPQPEVEA